MVKERTKPELRTYPNRLELAGYYSEDAADFYARYRLTYFSEKMDFQEIKSRRVKAYIDLRMAIEALLKAGICLRGERNLSGRPLVTKIRRYSHRIGDLADGALRKIADVEGRYIDALKKCDQVPIDLRYQFDAMQFRYPNELYYQTIGDDGWLRTLEEMIEFGHSRVQRALSRQSGVVSGRILAQEMVLRKRDY